ncbi:MULTISPECIES: Gldg family protein [unclassified Chitinophaga]|uniref:Gldg family protein n=1 Tax=unclassified Chitinophaga TaxID=2619133 RepID=UPI00300F89A7
MKMIFKVAKTELRNLFYSPVAWFLTIAFMVQCAFFYTYTLYPFTKWQEIFEKNNPKFKDFNVSLTSGIFLDPAGMFANVLQNLYLFVPLLTMGLISREINNGTIKLLYSSPVKLREIVFGKYFAIMLYNLLLVGIVAIFIVTGLFNIRSADYGMLLSAMLGFYLLMCSYTAIGLFMSSLTTYQIVSAIGSFLIVFILGRIGSLWQKYDFVRDLTYFLSLSGRTGKMLQGLITTKDVIYFVLIIYMFVSFTMIKLKGGRESKPWFVKAARYAAVMILVLTIGYVSSRPALTGYWDTTVGDINTLHPNTQKIIKELGKEPLEITLYTNLLGNGANRGFPETRNDYLAALWERYQRFKPDITFKYVYYYDTDDNDSSIYRNWPGKNLKEIAAQVADGYDLNASMFMPREEIRKKIDLGPENYRLVMQLKYKGETAFVRTFDDNVFWPQEEQVAPALKRLLKADLPRNIFLTGNLERSITKRGEREFRLHTIDKTNRNALINAGFESDTLSLDNADIPANTTTLVLADPKTALSATTMSKLKQYIDEGGNLFIVGEPGKQQLLNPLLAQLGVRLMDGTLVQLSRDEMPHMATPFLTHTTAYLADEPALILLREAYKEHGDSMFITTPGTTAFAYADTGAFVIKPLLQTIENRAWLKAGALVTDSTPPVFNPAEGDSQAKAYATFISLERKVNNKEQRIVLGGDADVFSNLRQGGGFVSKGFYSWLDFNHYPIYTPRPRPLDSLFTVSSATAAMLKILYVWILPGAVLLFAIILLIRRKRK